MSNRTEVDYEKQFQEDIEKATALSLETLAWEELRRTKFQHSNSSTAFKSSVGNVPVVGGMRPRPGSFNADSYNDSVTTIAPPPVVPPRRHSEIRLPSTERINSATTTDNNEVEDLMSFSSPTNKKEENVNFEKLIEDIQKLSTQVQPYPVQPNYSFGSTPSLLTTVQQSSMPNTMQLVPYNTTQQQQQAPVQQQKVPLTSENLNQLYNMQKQTVPFGNIGFHHPQQTRIFHHPMQQQSPPVIPLTNSYSFPPPPPYGFQMHLFPNQPSNMQTTPQQAILTNLVANNRPQAPTAQIPKSSSLSGVSSLLSSSSQKLEQRTNNHNLSNTTLLAGGKCTNTSVVAAVAAQSTSPKLTNSNFAGGNEIIVRRPKKSVGSNDDLIDLGHEDNSRVSVLEAFDPLLREDLDESGDNTSDCTTSYYAEYDPFDYLYSCGTQYSDPVYEAVNKTDRTPMSPSATTSIGWKIPSYGDEESLPPSSTPPPPLPPRNSIPDEKGPYQVLDRRKVFTRLYEAITDRKTDEAELMEFYYMVKELRMKYKYNDTKMNIGHVIASEFDNKYPEEKSIKILVYPTSEILRDDCEAVKQNQISGFGSPVAFTCDINTSVEHVIMHVFCALEGQVKGVVTDFMLKPIGLVEWLSPTSKLGQLECVHNSIKLEKDVQLGLCPKNEANMFAIARTQRDDVRDAEIKPEDILPNEHASAITYENMMILIETLEAEIDKLESNAAETNSHSILSCSGVIQGVKAICALLGSIDTLELANAVNDLKTICAAGQIVYSYGVTSPDIVSESGDYAEVTLRPKTIVDQIKYKCNQIRESIQELINTYANAFRVDFCVKTYEYITNPISVSHVLKPIMVNLSCLHRPPPHWKYDDYSICAQICHGTRFISKTAVAQCSNETGGGLFPRLKFETWITFEDIGPLLISSLPRESRLIFILFGCKDEPTENDQSNASTNSERRRIKVELGWCAVQLFSFQREMICGTYLLSFWPPTADKFLGPAPAKGCHPQPDFCPVLSIELPNYGGRITFPESPKNPPLAPKYDFNSLDCNLQQELLDTAEQGYPGALDKREVFWEKRHYLQDFPHALPKVLHAAIKWDCASLIDLHSLIKSWHPLSPLQSLELLLPRYPDLEVRAKAVEWISKMPNDQLVDYLPQLLQALKHDTYEASDMAKFLLCKCLESPRIAHHMYWLLIHSLPGDAPQNSMDGISSEFDESLITQARYYRRNKMMLRALLAICGENLLSRFLSQNMMCKNLAEIAQSVKQAKESMRQTALMQGMETVNQILLETPTVLPLGPGYEVSGVNVRSCSYFNSNTLPLKIAFLGPDHSILPAIFKSGDDLQQDMLTIQLVRIMDKLWLAEGLDLKMVTFNCIPTGYKKGMIELVSDAETLRKIQVEYGLTGSFKDRPIAEWLAKQNPSQLEYQRAVDNFTVSCAGYSVATYILGICDRHNDNIMLKTSGHLFHIDFGKFLGDAQMFGNFKRDRTPFVLTSDMAYVINGGDKPSTKFHHFVDLCCRAFNIVRNHGDLILHMLALMATAGIPGVTADAVTYVRRALLPSQSNPEAAASFAKMIQFSLKSWFTQFNFFLHNLAQLRFSNGDESGELLSFVPRTYTMQQDGRLKSVTVHGYQKRYDLEKHYTYILKVTRQAQPDPAYLFRSYKEFLEFHQKLCLHYPLAKLHSLPTGIHVGRSNIKSVAERRLPEIRAFLVSLFNAADEIAHSDLVYTFFHPLLRDQQEANIHVSKVKDVKPMHKSENVCGEIKLSLQYRRGALTVMIHHARGLPTLAGGQEPNTYVKCYLKPDPAKATKRKTKVVRKTCVPSFMETLEYRMPLEYIQNRILEVTIWSHDTLQENELLGGFTLDLSKYDLREELIEWFRLGYLPRP